MTAQQLKASILQLAIQGKLVPQIPEDEPASELLKHIKAEKDALVKAGKLKKDKHESVITRSEDGRYLEKKDGKTTDITDEIPFDIPDSWEWTRLGTMVDSFQYGTAEKASPSGKVPVLRMGNLQNGEIDYTKLVFSSNENDIQQYKLHFGDLLFNRTNSAELVGKTSVFRADTDAIFAGYLIRFRPILANSFYVNFVMNSSYQRGYCQSVRSDAINQSNINAQKLNLFLVPLPPLEEQKRIVAKIEGLLPHIEEYGKAETALSKLNAELPEQLKKSILQWAIQGRLVPQDPTDEPASELLKRIKSEKAALIKSGKLKKEKPLPPISEDEIPFDIPESWEWVRLGSLFHISPRNDVEDDVDVGFMPMSLLQEGFRNSHSFEVRKWCQVKNGFTHFMNGDIVIAKITPCFQNRKSAIISNLPNEFGAGTTELHVLRDETHLLCLRYFLWMFKTHAFIESGVKHFTGTAGQQRIGKDFLSNYLVPIPPLAEQKRIVEKLETLLSALDNQT